MWMKAGMMTLVASGVASAVSVATEAPISLETAFQSALKLTNPVRIQQETVRQAEARVLGARGLLLPTVSAGLGYSRIGSGEGVTNENSLSTKLTVSQPLFDTYRYYAALSAAREYEAAEKFRMEAVRLSVYVAVARAYYDLLSAVQDVKNLSQLVGLSQKRAAELRDRVKKGRSRNSELLSAKAQVASVTAQLAMAEGKVTEARDRLAFQTGLARSTEVSDPGGRLPAVAPLDHYLSRLGSRPDIHVLEKNAEASHRLVNAAFAKHLPTLDITGNYFPYRTGNLSDSVWEMGLVLSFPIFQGGVVRAQVHEASAKFRESDLALDDAKRQADLSIRAAYEEARTGILSVSKLKEAADLAEQNYAEQRKDYQLGLVTNLDVIQALNAFVDSRRAVDRTIYQVHTSFASLQAAIGDLP